MTQVTRRRFIQAGLAAGAALSFPAPALIAADANESVNLGIVGLGWRGGEHSNYFSKLNGVNIAGLCDPDETLRAKYQERFPKAKAYADLRDMFADKDIDAVVIATCNHWHCLAAIWAMEAGKDVYVEKPLSHTQWEGQQAVLAAKKYGRVCQVGTQQRSDAMQAEIKKFLHEEKALGEIKSARVNRYGVRPSIGKRSTPLEIPETVDYNLWLGPAQDQPLYRDKLHYDWHWDFNTGSGEMGNWGVHVLDDCRNVVFQDSVIYPKRIIGGGGRVVWDDAGNTPNVHFAYFDTGSIPVVIGLANITAGPNEKGSPKHPGPGSGYIAYCEGGRYEGQRGKGVAYDNDGKKIKEFKGNGGNGVHHQNFIDAVRAQDPSMLNTPIAMGHHSTGWCNLANVAYQAGKDFTTQEAAQVKDRQWYTVLGEMSKLLNGYGIKIESSEIKLSPVLEFDTETELFVGDTAGSANQHLKREYRDGFVVPTLG